MEEPEKKKESKIAGRFGARFRARTDKKEGKGIEAAAKSVAEPEIETAPAKKHVPSMDNRPPTHPDHPTPAAAGRPSARAPRKAERSGKPEAASDMAREARTGQGRAAKPAGKPAKPAVKPAAGPEEAKPPVKAPARSGKKSPTGGGQPRQEDKPQQRREPRPQQKQEPRQEDKPQQRQEPRQEDRPQQRREPRPQQRQEPQQKQEPRQEDRPQQRREPRPQQRQEPRRPPRPEVEPAPEHEHEPEAETGGETRTTYVDRQGDFDHFISDLRRQKRFGIDLEADSLHHYQEKICLIQIGFPGKVYIIDPLAEINLGPLARILTDSRVEKVLHGADYDGRLIMSHLGVRLRSVFDTMLAAQILGKPQVGLASLLSDYFQVTMDKRHQRADWSRRPLAPSMLEYAGLDAEHLLNLRDALAKELEEAGRLSWALEEFEILEGGLETLPGRSQEIYRTKGDRDLDPRQAALLQSLLRWREGVAKRKDIPPFKIIPNEMLIKLAMLPPGEEDVIKADILTPRLRSLYGPEIQKAFNKGRNSSPLELPSKIGGGESRRLNRSAEKRLNRLKEWRSHFAHDLSLDPGVMIPNSVMESVAITNPRDLAELIGSGLLKRWQLQLFGEALLQILHSVSRDHQ